MKREILFSACGHLIIIAALLLLSSPLGKSKIYPTIYQVSLISLPKLEVKTAQAQELPAPKVILKEEKTLPKKVTAKKKPPEPAKEEPNKTQEQNPTQQIEGLGQATLEGERLESPYYAGIVFAKIKSMWRNPVESASLQATISFKIQKDGEVTDAAIEVSSGNNLYDQAALRAVLTASPMPPLPTHYAGKDLTVHLNFVGVP
jgi:TonB family protein